MYVSLISPRPRSEQNTHAWSPTVLDQYARQNLAEIDEIEYEEEIVKVELPAAEMAYVLTIVPQRIRQSADFLLTLQHLP